MFTTEYRSDLFSFAFIPNYNGVVQYLAENLADSENWNFSDSEVKKYSILKSYLEYTFRRLKNENKIKYTKDNKHACINTGLVTHNLEDIYMLFDENTRNASTDDSPFFFKGFHKKSSAVILKHFSDDLPDIANYFENPELLIFNPKCELITDIDHIIEDNKDRFPIHLVEAGSSEIRRQLIGAVDEAKKRVRTNYKIAVPQHFNGRTQLLLPLCLTPGSSNPDLALVVYRINETTYSARTCLTLKMAYNNSRLICKPQSFWLKP